MNRNEFEQTAKGFRAGRITLARFADMLFPDSAAKAAEATVRGTLSSNAESSNAESSNAVDPELDPAETAATETSVARKKADPTIAPPASSPFSARGLARQLASRPADAHKGNFGRVLVVGGSASMPGAISLSGQAALRSGSGLVVIATSAKSSAAVSAFSPCYMVETFAGEHADNDDFDIGKEILAGLAERRSWADVIAIGPGLSRAGHLQRVVTQLFANSAQPMVVDADALNQLASAGADLLRHNGVRIITPHPGEFSRLVSRSFTSREEMENAAVELALSAKLIVVLKGNRTFVSDGKVNWRNGTGNPGMATGGSGDVLTGIIASLVGQGLNAIDAARLGVELHGLAGDVAAERVGQVSMIATDILEAIPAAFCRLAAS